MQIKRKKSLNMRFRVNDPERNALQRLAKLEAMTLSEAVRLAVRESCKARGIWPPEFTPKNGKARGIYAPK